MTIIYDNESVTITEEGVKFYNFFGGILLIIISAVLLWLRRFAVDGSKADNYLTAGGYMGIVVGLGAMLYAFAYKEKIYNFTPGILHVMEKKSGNMILDIDKSELSGVMKEVKFNLQNPNENPKLTSINYKLKYGSNQTTIEYSSQNPNPLEESQAFDQFLTENYDVQIDINQIVSQPKN